MEKVVLQESIKASLAVLTARKAHVTVEAKLGDEFRFSLRGSIKVDTRENSYKVSTGRLAGFPPDYVRFTVEQVEKLSLSCDDRDVWIVLDLKETETK